MKKKVLIAVPVVLLAAIAVVAGSVFLPFRALAPPPEAGQDLPGGARLINDGFANSYLLSAGDVAALVDCGDDANGAAILSELKKRGMGPENVKAIFLTHGHPDHTGACHLFKNAEVYAFEGDKGIADGTKSSHGPITSIVSGPPEKRITVTKTLNDGETITVGDLHVVAFLVPGHTAGSAVYLSGGVLFMGDCANYGRDGTLHAAMPMFTDDGAQNRKSIKELAGRLAQRGDKIDMTAYGHSAPSDGIKALAAFTP
ncbi:MAG: MBL fold metallo-hydrolase [Geminicoccaceae bacterium]